MWDDIFGYSRFGGFGGGYGWDGGPDRSTWREKSDAALRRERDAVSRFDAFLKECESSTTFPVTKEVVPPQVHLTDACWKTFKQHVLATGCTTKRREATREERLKSKDTRKGKLYVISVTCPIHPSQAKEAALEKKQKAAAAAAAKKAKQEAAAEKARLERQRQIKEQQELDKKVKEEYAIVLECMNKNKSTEEDGDGKKRVLQDVNKSSEEGSPSKKVKLTAPTPAMLNHAEKMHQVRLRQIANKVADEKYQERTKLLQELDERMNAREAELKKEAREDTDEIKSMIEKMSSK